jgi:hypothetical protein
MWDFSRISIFDSKRKPPLRAGKTLLVGGLVVVSAVLISLSTIYTLVVTQISGTAGGGQSESDKAGALAIHHAMEHSKVGIVARDYSGPFRLSHAGVYDFHQQSRLLLGQDRRRPAYSGLGEQRSAGADQRRAGAGHFAAA